MSFKKTSNTAIILCGGLGSRLRPYTTVLPKPLMPINDRPILEIIIKQLKKNKFKQIFLSIGYKGDLIKTYFGNGIKYGLSIKYIEERKPLGTMGPLKIIDELPCNFLVMNGDILTNLNYKNFLNKHINSQKVFSISTTTRRDTVDYGVIEHKENKMVNFLEKPKKKYQVSMGVYGVSKKVLKYIPKNKFFGFDDLMRLFLKKKINVNLIFFKGFWLDIGRNSDYMVAQETKINKWR